MEGSLLENILSLQGAHLLVQDGPLADWMRPTPTLVISLLYLKLTNSNVILNQKHPLSQPHPPHPV